MGPTHFPRRNSLKKEIQGMEMFKRADVGVGVVLAVGLEGRDLSQGRRSQELYQSHISWTRCPPGLHEQNTVVLGSVIVHGTHSKG